jgi:hypothetical protein
VAGARAVTLHALEPDDEAALGALDAAYAEAYGVEPLISAAAVSFFARSGHAFVAREGGTVLGFVLAQAVWGGARPTLQTPRLIGPRAVREALLAALVKSAYDAAVLDLTVAVPAADTELAELLAADGWREQPLRSFVRALGSRARRAP